MATAIHTGMSMLAVAFNLRSILQWKQTRLKWTLRRSAVIAHSQGSCLVQHPRPWLGDRSRDQKVLARCHGKQITEGSAVDATDLPIAVPMAPKAKTSRHQPQEVQLQPVLRIQTKHLSGHQQGS